MKNKNIQHGRSMIEMLGVLGIMAVITVLGILIYQLALKNSKMNKLKQDVANISQALDQSYSRQKFTDTGVVLGTDRTFYNMFVDTNFFKSATTPFGGTYSLTGISQDLFELKVTGPEESDCKYMVSDDSFLKRLEKATLACEDENGLIHYASNHPDNGENIAGGLSDEAQELLASHDAQALFNMCRFDSDMTACEALASDEEATLYYLQHACYYTQEDSVCSSLAEHPDATASALLINCTHTENVDVCESYFEKNGYANQTLYTFCSGNTDLCEKLIEEQGENATATLLSSVCATSADESACLALVDNTEAIVEDFQYACYYSSQGDVCSSLAEHPDATASILSQNCIHTENTDVCEGYFEKNGYANQSVYTFCSGNTELCETIVSEQGENAIATLLSSVCATSADDSSCLVLADNTEATNDDLRYACYYSSQGDVCSSLAEHPDATASGLSQTCIHTENTDVCEGYFEKNGYANQSVYTFCSGNTELCETLVSEQGENTTATLLSSVCATSADDSACLDLVDNVDATYDDIRYACYYSSQGDVCSSLANHPEVTSSVLSQNCNYNGNTDVCQASCDAGNVVHCN